MSWLHHKENVRPLRNIWYDAAGIALFFALCAGKLIVPALIVLLVICWLLRNDIASKLTEVFREPAKTLLITFFLLHAVSILYSSNLDAALFDLEVKLSLLIAPLIIIRSPHHLFERSFVHGCILAIVLFVSNATFLFWLGEGPEVFFYTGLSHFLHPSYLSMYLTLAAAIIISLPSKTDRWRKVNWYIFLPAITAFQLLLTSRTGIVSYLIIVGFCLLRNTRGRGKLIIAGVFTIISFIAVLTIFSNKGKSFLEKTGVWRTISLTDTENNARLASWSIALEKISENPFFGTGTGDVKEVLVAGYLEKGYEKAAMLKLNAHNQFLQTSVALGLLGLACLLSLFIVPFIKKRRHPLLVPFLLLIFINSFTESLLETQAGVILFAFFYSLTAQPINENPDLVTHNGN